MIASRSGLIFFPLGHKVNEEIVSPRKDCRREWLEEPLVSVGLLDALCAYVNGTAALFLLCCGLLGMGEGMAKLLTLQN